MSCSTYLCNESPNADCFQKSSFDNLVALITTILGLALEFMFGPVCLVARAESTANACFIWSTVSLQCPAIRCLNKQAVGYHGESLRSNNQRQS